MNRTEMFYGSEWKKNADSLADKRNKALEYLGDKWILKGGQYTSKLKTLGKEGTKSTEG